MFEHNTLTAREAFGSLDAAILVLTADPPISAAERDLLRHVSALALRTFVVLNKADQLSAGELADAAEFTASVCGDACGEPVPVYPLSARRGGDDTGFARFRAMFEDYLGTDAGEDTVAALRMHARRLASRLLDDVTLRRRALELAHGSATDTVSAFTTRLTAIRAQALALDDRCWAAERRLRRALNDAAAALSAELAVEARQRVVDAFTGSLTGVDATGIEQQGRALLIDTIRDRVESWRADRAELLRTGLVVLLDDVSTERDTQLRLLRDAAHELLDVDLTDTPPAALLSDTAPFQYAFDPLIGWEMPLAGAARRLAPGRSRRARDRVLREAGELADRQVGRARAQLQQRLTDGIHALLADLRRGHRDVLDRLHDAMTDASTRAADTSADVTSRTGDLSERAEALASVLHRLGPPL